MGFTTLATTALAVGKILPDAMQAHALNKQSKSLNSAADEQLRLAERQASHITRVALSNSRRAARNAAAQMGAARADAAASHLAAEGSAHLREQDLATRLQDEINSSANSALHQANQTREQGALNAWNTRQAAAQAKVGSISAGLSAAGSLFGDIGRSLNA